MTDRRKPETILGAAIVDVARDLGIPIERVQAGKHAVKRGYLHCASEGTPDYVTPMGWVELKLPGRKPRPNQREWHDTWQRWGARVATVSSAEEFLRVVLAWRAEQMKGARP